MKPSIDDQQIAQKEYDLQSILGAEQPSEAYTQMVQESPESTARLMQQAETQLAVATAEWDLGLHTEKEKEVFSDSLDAYTGLMALSIGHKMDTLLGDGIDEPEAKHEVVTGMLASVEMVVEKEVLYRLDNSRLERFAERLGDGRITTQMGKLATAGATGVVAWAGLKTAFGPGIPAEVPIALAAAASHVGMGLAGDKMSRVVGARLDRYKPLTDKTDAKGTPVIEDEAIPIDDLDKHKRELSVLEGELYAACGKTFIAEEEGESGDQLATILAGSVADWYRRHYQVPTLKDRITRDDKNSETNSAEAAVIIDV